MFTADLKSLLCVQKTEFCKTQMDKGKVGEQRLENCIAND